MCKTFLTKQQLLFCSLPFSNIIDVKCQSHIRRAWKYDNMATLRTMTEPVFLDSIFVCFWRNSPTRARAASCSRFLDHTQLHTKGGRTPLDEGSAHRRDIYLEHTTLTRHRYPCPQRDSKPQFQQGSGRTPSPYTARPLGSALTVCSPRYKQKKCCSA
jgi:hypothetical protein